MNKNKKIDINWLSDDDKYQYAIDCMQLEIDRLQERYDNLKKEHIDTITRNEDYRARIDKAIEYINGLDTDSEQQYYNTKTNMYEDYIGIIKEILQGSDDE